MDSHPLLDAVRDFFREILREELQRALAEHNGKPALLANTKEAAELLQVPESWVASAARRGELKSIRCGHHVRFSVDDLNDFIQQKR